MINDIVVKLEDKSFILFDTKYKKIFNKRIQEDDEIDPIYNISQSDIYQMVSYAVGSGISDVGLIYPELPFESKKIEMPIYEIVDEFKSDTVIRIFPSKVDIVHLDGLELQLEGKLEDIFAETNRNLIKQLNNCVTTIWQFKNSFN
jgi:5-methylcytosine-specific restriction endonuclease McrBC regulatory subunit McrC